MEILIIYNININNFSFDLKFTLLKRWILHVVSFLNPFWILKEIRDTQEVQGRG